MFVANAPFSLRTLAIFMPLMTRRLSKRTIPRRSPQPHFPPKIAWFQAETDRNWGWVTEFLLVVFQEEMSFNPRIRGFADPVFSRFQPLQTSPRISKARPPNLVSSSLSASNHFILHSIKTLIKNPISQCPPFFRHPIPTKAMKKFPHPPT
jgi:hypothetical protein